MDWAGVNEPNIDAGYLPGRAATCPRLKLSRQGLAGPPGIGRNQILSAVLELAIEALDRLESVDLARALVGPDAHYARKAKREAGLMTRRTLDHVEGHFDYDRRLDLPETAEAAKRVGLEPGGHFGYLRVCQTRVGLANRDQPFGGFVADRERVVGQDGVTLAVADLDTDDHAVDGRQRPLHLQPAQATPSRRVHAGGILDHQALVAAGSGLGEDTIQGRHRIGRHQM